MDVLRLTLRQLQVFVAVARAGSTTAAGEHIALSQSATSAAINELERLLSLRLFDRAGKRLLLNDSGRALLPRALALLDGAADIERIAQDGQARALRLGASTTIGNYLLPELLSRHVQSGPHDGGATWQSKVMIGNTAEVCAAVAGFELDIGLIEGPCHEPALDVHPWLRDSLVIVAAPPLARALAGDAEPGSRIPLRVLREQTWLLREVGSGTREATDHALLSQLRAYHRSIELGSSEAIKRAAAAGLGLACLSSWVVEELLTDGRLVLVPAALPAMGRQCHIVVHRQKHLTPALRAFIDRAMAYPVDQKEGLLTRALVPASQQQP